MRVISSLTIILYSVFFFLLGAALVLMAANVITKDFITYTLEYIYGNTNMHLVIGAIGTLLIIVTLLVIRIIIGKMRMERTIAFDNPDGQVTISLSAIEDFIKRLTRQLPEIKELKPSVIATKKGVDVTARLVLYSDANIPDVTEKIQGLIKVKIQEILGIEDSILVRVHIAKIAQREDSRESRMTKDKEPTATYRGIEY